ncbi:MAG: N-acetylneuraminate synthase family protein [Kiritimatiellaeota bacterium]|nr:N-acetylneuraminate synthase family protein [Kiritimatiellota bacterium]
MTTSASTTSASPATLRIGGRELGPGRPALLIAEVAQAHDGSLGTAHAYIEALAAAGADAVKFQTHIAAAESTLDEPFRIRFSPQDETRYAYWKRMEFTAGQWAGLAAHARDRGLLFLSSPFSTAAVDLLAGLGLPAWKIGSGEFRSRELLEAVIAAGGPVLLSTGMSRWDEVAAMTALLREHARPFALFQCTSRYPAPLEETGLNMLDEFRARFACAVGLSDHSGTVFPTLAAMARGAELVEVHVVFDRRAFGPDTPASVTVDELALLARARDAFQRMLAHPVDKDGVAALLAPMRDLFAKSIAPARVLAAGTVLTADLLVPRKPGTGIPFTECGRVTGRRLAREVRPDRLLAWEDLA